MIVKKRCESVWCEVTPLESDASPPVDPDGPSVKSLLRDEAEHPSVARVSSVIAEYEHHPWWHKEGAQLGTWAVLEI